MKNRMIKMASRVNPAPIAVVVAIVLLSSLVPQGTFAQDLKSELKAPAPLARMSGVAAVAKGKLYFIGGITKAPSATGVVHEYSAAQNKWSSKASMPTPRFSAAAVELNGAVYVLGGRRDNDVFSIVEKYDPAGNSWSKCASMPTARWHFMAAVTEGKIYAFGGIAGVGNARRVLDVVEVYDPAQDRWSSYPAMPIGNSNAGEAVVGSKIYLIGGRIRAGARSGSATRKVYVYDTSTGKWEMGPSMNKKRAGLEACAVNGTVYAVGGASSGKLTASVEVLARGVDEWTLVPTLRKNRTDHNCAVLGQKIYVVGGISVSSIDGIEDTLEELIPSVRD